MGVSLNKGSSVSLNQQVSAGRLQRVLVGLGWDPIDVPGAPPHDLDASAFLLGSSGLVAKDANFVFFNNPDSPTGAVHYGGDSRDGVGDGDDEQLTINLDAVPLEVATIAFAVTIDSAEKYGHHFGQVRSAFIRVVDAITGASLARFDLTAGASTATAFVFGEVYRDGSEWRFAAVGDEVPGGLAGVARSFGVVID